MRFRFIAAILIAGMSAPAFASNWVLFGSSRLANRYYYDSESVRRAGPIVYVWTKNVSDTEEAKDRIAINCASGEWTLTYISKVGSDGKLQSFSTRPQYAPIVPDSIADTMRRKFCRPGKP